jgi:hypothetical protein
MFPSTPFTNPVAGAQPPPGTETPQPGPLFGGPTPLPAVPFHAPTTSALNLLGKAESWGIGPATNVRNLRLRTEKLTGSQLKKLLAGLPDGLSYELDLEKESD